MAEPINPECRDDKHRNCDDTALDEKADEIVQCTCACHDFERRAEQERQEDTW